MFLRNDEVRMAKARKLFLLLRFVMCCILLAMPALVKADEEQLAQETGSLSQTEPAGSPWVLVPLFSSDPKVGTSLGMMGGYLFKLDPGSTSSIASLVGTYSNTNSYILAALLRSYWDGDSKRLLSAFGAGKIFNDYSDFLGTGLPISTTDDVRFIFARYLQEVREHWFIGGQGIYTNYLIVGDNFQSEEILKLLGLTGFESGALGLVLMYDNTDNQNSPTGGMRFSADSFSYRKAFGAEQNFDTLNLQFKRYLLHADKNVFAYRLNGRWTFNAPVSGYSSVALRGYVRGQYLAPHSLLIEVEERWRLTQKFGVNLFAGVACLYGGQESENYYPGIGFGVQYLLDEAEKIVLTADYAKGEGDNSGLYVRFGQAF